MDRIKTFFKNLDYGEVSEITFGVFLLSAGFYFFFLPSNLVTGGVLGLSIIFQDIVNSESVVTIFVTVVNMALLILGGLILGKKFFLNTVYGSVLLSLFLFIFEVILKLDDKLVINQLTQSSFLISAIFGGILTGIGLGLVLRNDATTGGTDILQRIANKFFKVPFSVALYIIDGVIIILGIVITKSLEGGFYAIGALLIVGVVVDHMMLRGASGYTVFIVTKEFEAIQKAIYKGINRGITKTAVVGGYSLEDKDMIICTITKKQLYDLKHIISETDPAAFTFIVKANETLGQGFKKVDV